MAKENTFPSFSFSFSFAFPFAHSVSAWLSVGQSAKKQRCNLDAKSFRHHFNELFKSESNNSLWNCIKTLRITHTHTRVCCVGWCCHTFFFCTFHCTISSSSFVAQTHVHTHVLIPFIAHSMYDEIKLKTAANEKLPTVKLLPTIFLNSEIKKKRMKKEGKKHICMSCNICIKYWFQIVRRPFEVSDDIISAVQCEGINLIPNNIDFDWLLSLTSHNLKADHKSYINTFMHYWIYFNVNRELYTSNHFYVHIKRCRSQEKPFEIAAQQYLELPYDIKIPIRIANEFFDLYSF